ncbi:mitochondrial precursor protein-like protein import receptor tom70 [Trichodelitschia bisporula]|uniref:Mitochondrial protein-like protein import receptor tom70 n=1 Tax=Trichodelitschia bisporula TaxID=703511 RepID=A0A6G1HUN7_9PEZI|nr:mitochondrial precursor protein-like protein import receptor tom70 [Trichodelitschia bisporula]
MSSSRSQIEVPAPPLGQLTPIDGPPQGLIDRLSTWASENKALVYTIAGVTLVVGTAGVIYYMSDTSSAPKDDVETGTKKKSKKRKGKKEEEKQAEAPKVPTGEEELPEVDEDTVGKLSDQERKEFAAKLKAAGNKAYGAKDYIRAIDLYGKAIICKQEAVFYSNRAACWHALSDWDKVIEDTTAAINLEPTYVKALNRRANAYEQVTRYSEALLDYTASCIIDQFADRRATEKVEVLLKKVAEEKGKAILAGKEKKLPSPTFVTNYLQSFRPQPPPAGLEETADLDENSGKGQLKKGLLAMRVKTADGYAQAAEAFDRALQLGGLDEHEAFAYNWRGTFRYLRGDSDGALKDVSKSLELDPSFIQSYIKRASMHLEQGEKDAASKDFETAAVYNNLDPDIYYHRAQLHFILGEFTDAAKDYQKSIDLDKDFIFSHIQLGVTQYKLGSVASSMATFRKIIKNFEKVPDVYNYYGELLLDQQQFQKAIEQFETAIEMEKQQRPVGMNVLPLINKALALFQWKQDFAEAEDLCKKALILDPECDIAVATMAQLLLQQGKVPEALNYFERAAELSRTEGEIINALSYAEATRTQLEVTQKYPQLTDHIRGMGNLGGQMAR